MKNYSFLESLSHEKLSSTKSENIWAGKYLTAKIVFWLYLTTDVKEKQKILVFFRRI